MCLSVGAGVEVVVEPHHLRPPLLLPGPQLPRQEADQAAAPQPEVVPEEGLPVLLARKVNILTGNHYLPPKPHKTYNIPKNFPKSRKFPLQFSLQIFCQKRDLCLVEAVLKVSVVCSDLLARVDVADGPEVLGLLLGVGGQLG